MKTFNAKEYTEDRIELEDNNKLEELYNTIENEENFILLLYLNNNLKKSVIVISSNLKAKVANGDIILSSSEEK